MGFDFTAVVHAMGLQIGNQLGVLHTCDHELTFGFLPALTAEPTEIQMPGGLLALGLEAWGVFGGLAAGIGTPGLFGGLSQAENAVRLYNRALNLVRLEHIPETAVGYFLDRRTGKEDRLQEYDTEKTNM